MDNAQQQDAPPERIKLDASKPESKREALLFYAVDQLAMAANYEHTLKLRWQLLFIAAFIGNIVQWWASR